MQSCMHTIQVNIWIHTVGQNFTNMNNAFLIQEILGRIWKCTDKCNHCNYAQYQTGNLRTQIKMHSDYMSTLIQVHWGHIKQDTVEKSQTNATNVTLHLLGQVIWGDIWKHTLEKSQINAINVTLHPHRQAIWGGIWKHIVETSQINATNVTLHRPGQPI